MKTLSFLFCTAALASCANLHRYDGPDAALVARACHYDEALPALDGKRYFSEIGVGAIDRHLPGTGVSCHGNRHQRVNPAAREIEFFVTYQEPEARHLHIGLIPVSVQLQPRTNYTVDSSFDGTTMRLVLRKAATGDPIAQAETREVRRQSTANAALMALPLIAR